MIVKLCEARNIDESEVISLVRLNVELNVLAVIHKGRVRHRLGSRWVLCWIHVVCHKPRRFVVIPIRQSHNKFGIILKGSLRVVNNEGTTQPINILNWRMAVVPVSTGLGDVEGICERLTGSNFALHSSGRSIHSICSCLVEAMPVDTRVLVWDLVVHIHGEDVSNIDINSRIRPTMQSI